MKKIYEKPIVEIEKFTEEESITTNSGLVNFGDIPGEE